MLGQFRGGVLTSASGAPLLRRRLLIRSAGPGPLYFTSGIASFLFSLGNFVELSIKSVPGDMSVPADGRIPLGAKLAEIQLARDLDELGGRPTCLSAN